MNIDVALIQEPYAYCHADQITVANVPNGYTAVHELDVMHAYGAAIVVKDTLKPIRASLAANHTIGVHLLTHKPALTFSRSKRDLPLPSYCLSSSPSNHCRRP